MTAQQWIIFGILIVTLALFVWNRWRYDVVSLAALLVVTVAGIVPPDEVFSGFSHPAVITVVAVLVVSKALFNAGVIDLVARQLGRVGDRPTIQVAALTGLVTVFSGFMNNIGASADPFLMCVAVGASCAFLIPASNTFRYIFYCTV